MNKVAINHVGFRVCVPVRPRTAVRLGLPANRIGTRLNACLRSFSAPLVRPWARAEEPAASCPLTNKQSNEDGTVSDYDLAWIERCARGGYAMTMTCAANVQSVGKGFQGQLGIYDDRHIEGLARLAALIRAGGSVSSVQLHHGGARALGGVNGVPAGPSGHIADGARVLSTAEVEELRDDYITAAQRADSAGFDGVEVHGAFGHVLAQFLSPTLNTRVDHYGGSLEGRSRLLFEIIEGIRESCRPDFQIGLKLSMERFGLRVAEIRDVAAEAIRTGSVDYLDIAPHDIEKIAEEEDSRDARCSACSRTCLPEM